MWYKKCNLEILHVGLKIKLVLHQHRHFHPSGDITPSKEDMFITNKVYEASKVMDISLVDHIIVGGGSGDYYSMKGKGLFTSQMLSDSVMQKARKYEVKNDVAEITEKLETGIKDLYDSDKYKAYLDTMSRFYHYSPNNCLLIAMQKSDATYVAGYTTWQRSFERQVMRDQKGIKIISPAPYMVIKERDKLDPVTKQPIIGKDGMTEKEVYESTRAAFKVATVFDISQTEGKDLPEIATELKNSVESYEDFMVAIESVSPVPVEFLDIQSSAKGYYDNMEKKIVIMEGMSNAQTIKTTIHEVSHAKLHDKDTDIKKADDRRTKEIEAESIAYTVCQHYGIDTSDYSFGYVADWSSGKELDEFKKSLGTIRTTACDIISGIDSKVETLRQEREALRALPQGKAEEVVPTKSHHRGR